MLFRKPQLRNIHAKIERNVHKTKILHGIFGVRALESGWLTSEQIETLRRSIKRQLKPKEKIWLRLKPFKVLTGKSRGIRMGKGKGLAKHTVFQTKAGRILFEFNKLSLANKGLRSLNAKSPIKLDFVFRSTMH